MQARARALARLEGLRVGRGDGARAIQLRARRKPPREVSRRRKPQHEVSRSENPCTSGNRWPHLPRRARDRNGQTPCATGR